MRVISFHLVYILTDFTKTEIFNLCNIFLMIIKRELSGIEIAWNTGGKRYCGSHKT